MNKQKELIEENNIPVWKYRIRFYTKKKVKEKEYFLGKTKKQDSLEEHLEFIKELHLYERITAVCENGWWDYDSAEKWY